MPGEEAAPEAVEEIEQEEEREGAGGGAEADGEVGADLGLGVCFGPTKDGSGGGIGGVRCFRGGGEPVVVVVGVEVRVIIAGFKMQLFLRDNVG